MNPPLPFDPDEYMSKAKLYHDACGERTTFPSQDVIGVNSEGDHLILLFDSRHPAVMLS